MSIELPAAEPSMQFRLESCRVDKDACTPLCQRVIGLPDIAPGGGAPFFPDPGIMGCDVRFFDDSVTVTAHVRTYQEECVSEDIPNVGPPVRPPI